jgi:hypothetical protein
MITLYEFHEYILNSHNIFNFWNAKNSTSQSISYDYGFILFIKMLNWVIFFDIENSVMPLLHRKMILKDFENHKLRYTMKYDFFIKSFIHLN